MLVGRKVCGRAEGKWSWTCGQRLEKDHPILLSFWNRMPVFLHLWLFTRLTIFINSSPGLRSWAHAVVFKVAWEERKDHVPGQQLISFKKEKEIVAQARRDHFFPRPPRKHMKNEEENRSTRKSTYKIWTSKRFPAKRSPAILIWDFLTPWDFPLHFWWLMRFWVSLYFY